MATGTADLCTKEKWEEKAAGHADMGFILPLFPGDVRDTDDRRRGGPEAPAHPPRFTLPRSVAPFHSDDVSNVVALACAAVR
jgi:hypothetical protein